jgi:hypothetical protein
MAHQMHHDSNMEQCIENCLQCHRLCVETMTHCLHMGGKHAEANHIRLLADCAQICHTSADFMLRGSDMHGYTCAACAQVCQRCAEDCERIDPNDPQMRQCAEMCRRCAESCRRMASMAAA